MLVVFASLKGSPGVSCLSTAVAARLSVAKPGAPGLVSLLVEADPAGGVAAARAGLDRGVGLVSLAAEVRSGRLTRAVVARHVQQLPSGVAVLTGPGGGDEATSTVNVLADGLARFITAGARTGLAVVVDVGRLGADSVAWPLVDAADGVILLITPNVEGVEQLAAWLRVRPSMSARVALVLRDVRGPQFSEREITDELGTAVLTRVPDDCAAAITAYGGERRRSRRSQWWSTVGVIAHQIDQLQPRAGRNIRTAGNAAAPPLSTRPGSWTDTTS
ncbi:hypothetical protein [Pseudonocardia sp. TRM90224]|uniref:hypothetical protein n=1 Tax=Pseudonocardia sp. TRM90224 TaxID=2812678 RepID=UPI001E38D40E|nr:hypothetical protein [Pseudonocardia sp. TRM90224]